MSDWIGVLVPSLPLGELFVRGTVTYVGLVLLLRVVGRREAGGLGMTDLVVVLLVVNAASTGLTGDGETLGDGFVLVVTVLAWSVALDALSYRWSHLGRLFKAPPRVLIEDGRLNRRVMLRELMSEEEVQSQLRLHGIHDVDKVEQAWIEPSGMVSVVLREQTDESSAQRHPEL